MEPLSLAQTQQLSDILEARDWAALEDLLAFHGYDEGMEPDLNYQVMPVSYSHRFVWGPPNAA